MGAEYTNFPGTYDSVSTVYENTICYDDCGDGLLVDDSMYACDDGNNDNEDGCSAKC